MVELNPPGPVHNHEVAAVELALSVTVPPSHIGPSFDGAAVGMGFIVTVTLSSAPQQPDDVLALK